MITSYHTDSSSAADKTEESQCETGSDTAMAITPVSGAPTVGTAAVTPVEVGGVAQGVAATGEVVPEKKKRQRAPYRAGQLSQCYFLNDVAFG